MALLKFARAIEAGEPIEVYGNGQMRRDFTYVEDLVEAMVAILEKVPVMGQPLEGDSLSPVAPFRTLNIGGGRPVELMDFIKAIENAMGKKAQLTMLPMQPGDVVATEADTTLLAGMIGNLPKTSVDEGVARFVEWFREYNR
jgi:UDP-glucuronate 4-epimerase